MSHSSAHSASASSEVEVIKVPMYRIVICEGEKSRQFSLAPFGAIKVDKPHDQMPRGIDIDSFASDKFNGDLRLIFVTWNSSYKISIKFEGPSGDFVPAFYCGANHIFALSVPKSMDSSVAEF
ncbi:MAG UNVERIFIED_CONTAM: hypothetical protein LVQ98_07435 [Rickettsiaceae bacterium]|jgi:hypothetical protein